MKKRLFLHIGSHKTATTFLQSSFANSPAAMAELGILYPRSGMIHQAHFKLSGELRDPALAAKPLDHLPEWAAALAEIDYAPQSRVLISVEELGWGTDPARLSVLADRYDVQVIFYLRSPDSYMESLYNQFVKDFITRETRPIEACMAEDKLEFLDARALLAPWAEIFGPKAITLRIFDKAALPDGIMVDFLRVLGAKTIPTFKAPDVSILHKASLPPDALEYLRLTNPWLEKEEGHHDFVLGLVQVAQRHADTLQETRAGILSLKDRQMLRARFQDSHQAVAKAYMGVDRAPFLPSDAPPPPADFDSRKPEADARLMGRITALLRNAS